MAKKRVLICGISGFMGNNIMEYFLENTDYIVSGVSLNDNPMCKLDLPRSLYKLYKCDLTSVSGIDYVFNDNVYDILIMAAATTSGVKDTIDRPYIHVTDNVIINSLLLRKAHEIGINHIIFLSCSVMYMPGDEPRRESDFNESDEIFPSYFGVGSMKVYIEKQIKFYSSINKSKYTIIRHSNTYGPYDKYDLEKSHVFGATISKVMNSSDGFVSIWGNGTETARDLIYVKDVCEFIHNSIELQETKCEIVNVSYSHAFTIKEITEKIIDVSGYNLDIKYDYNRFIIPTKLSLNNDKAKSMFNWSPKTSFDDGIKKTLNWYKNFYCHK